MTTPPTDAPAPPWAGAVVVLGAALLAVVVARPYAASSNDGSRLATVECLVDYHTLRIDDSIFVRPPPRTAPARLLPYGRDYVHLSTYGTSDKIFVHGHFYSEKPPVAAFYMAGVYAVLQRLTGLKARDDPRTFCRWMTLTSSGVAYAVAVWGIWLLMRALRLSWPLALGLTASFALSTVALPYACFVNGHIPLLAVAALLLASLLGPSPSPLAGEGAKTEPPWAGCSTGARSAAWATPSRRRPADCSGWRPSPCVSGGAGVSPAWY